MKVILLKTDKNLGHEGDIVEVNAGYAKNFLLPKGIAMEASAANLNELRQRQAHDAAVAAKQLEEARALASKLEGGTIELTMKGGTSGRAFGSVSTKEIAAACKTQLGIELDKKKMILDDPIKEFGTFEVPIRLHPDVTGAVRVHVSEA